MKIIRSNIVLKANPKRVILRFLKLGVTPFKGRGKSMIERILQLDGFDTNTLYDKIEKEFAHRHKHYRYFLQKNYETVGHLIPEHKDLTKKQKLLIGAYFTKEYSIQSAALFNPSMIAHPDQKNLASGEKRFVISLRSVGEGHISSIEFRSGIVDNKGKVRLAEESPFSTALEKDLCVIYHKKDLTELLDKIEGNNVDRKSIENLPAKFTLPEYNALKNKGKFSNFDKQTLQFMDEFVDLNYDIKNDQNTALGEKVIFPNAESERMGMEDVRFVQFSEGKEKFYFGTYTAYDGHHIFPQLIMTKDFNHFNIRALYGKAVSDKGLALFPEKINGKYVMLGRQGGENISIMYADELCVWDNYTVIMKPEKSWGIVQLGNCGSPIKTGDGWLVITHAVGAMRKYVISAILLDLNDPSKIIGKLDKPLLLPNENEREGYVPNVVYSCGAMLHGEVLVIPYAMSDSASSFASVNVNELLSELKKK